MFADALESCFNFLHRSIPAKELLLLGPERRAGFDKIDLFNA